MKIAIIVVLVLVSVVVIIALIGMMLPANHVASTKASMPATPEQLWTVITDVNAFPSWRSDVKSVEILPATNGKKAWREDGSNGKISYEIVESFPQTRLKARLTDDSLPFGGSWTYVIEPAPRGSTLTITEDGIVRNPIFRFVSRFVFGHHRTQEIYLRDLGKKFGGTMIPVRI